MFLEQDPSKFSHIKGTRPPHAYVSDMLILNTLIVLAVIAFSNTAKPISCEQKRGACKGTNKVQTHPLHALPKTRVLKARRLCAGFCSGVNW